MNPDPTGSSPNPDPPPDPTNWDTITYKYDPSGKRIEKTGDGQTTLQVQNCVVFNWLPEEKGVG